MTGWFDRHQGISGRFSENGNLMSLAISFRQESGVLDREMFHEKEA
jgi:hypothetical protein